MAQRGRPSKLTPDVERELCDAIRQGAYLETAAALLGLNVDTVREWLRRGARDGEGPYADFAAAVKRAQAEAEMTDMRVISAAASGGVWQAAAWRLERKAPARWALRVKEAVREELQRVFEAAARELPPEHYHKLLAAVSGDEADPSEKTEAA